MTNTTTGADPRFDAASTRGSDRRSLFKSFGAAAAGALLLRDAVAQENNPAANVADRNTGLKITKLTPLPAGAKVFVKIETNRGVVGWGEVTGLEPTAAAALATSLFELLDGENPTRVEHLWQKIYRAHRDMRGDAFVTHVLSAIDMALWDVTGKLWGVPVHRLLGGPTRDKVRVYPSVTAHKNGTGGPHPYSGTPDQIERLVKMIKDTREKLGPSGAIMFDAHSALPPAMLIQFAAAIEPYDVLFIEEPAVPGNVEVFKRLKEQIRVPLATGERDRTIWGVLPYLHERCIDVLQPDCGHTGGITQMKKIATLAEAYFVPLAPHCTMSELGATASLQAAFACPFVLIHEYYRDGHIMPPGVVKTTFTVDEATGYAFASEAPGLGVEVDEAKLAEVAADPKRRYRWPGSRQPDGAVSDY